ncbi:MAG: biopolymer transporter ExbD [Candidatus Eiseniibacteriota bacterium]|jgi:biopolymer transport protein ExbD
MKFKRIKVSDEIPNSSMSDIAFLLLVFFIATTIFNVEEGLTLILPPKDAGVPKKVSRKNVMVIHSDANGNVFVDDELWRDVSRLDTEVARRYRENDKLVVSVESHPNSRYNVMIDILDEVKQAQVPRISIKTYSGEGGGG